MTPIARDAPPAIACGGGRQRHRERLSWRTILPSDGAGGAEQDRYPEVPNRCHSVKPAKRMCRREYQMSRQPIRLDGAAGSFRKTRTQQRLLVLLSKLNKPIGPQVLIESRYSEGGINALQATSEITGNLHLTEGCGAGGADTQRNVRIRVALQKAVCHAQGAFVLIEKEMGMRQTGFPLTGFVQRIEADGAR